MLNSNIKKMKRIILSFIFVVFAVASFAQAQHLKFMGIPLNGTIHQFQQKLASKGVQLNTFANKTLPVGVRAFKGVFSGYEADFYVYYNSKTKIVYRAKAVIEASNLTYAENVYETIKDGLLSKYEDNSFFTTGEQEEHESITFAVFSTKNQNQLSLGLIGLYVTKSVYSWQEEERQIHVDYEDTANSDKNEALNGDDL